jgi:hypothetical protein
MKKYICNRKILQTALLLLAIMLGWRECPAQLPIYFSSQDCGMVEYAEVLVKPPLSTYMPKNVMHPYIVLDSICKVYSLQEVQARLQVMSSDSIRIAMQYYYDVLDYDPILFHKYAMATMGDSNYQCNVPDFVKAVFTKYQGIAVSEMKDNLLLWTSYIYHIRVRSQVAREDSNRFTRMRKFCARAEVMNKLKGTVLPDPSRMDIGGVEQITLWWGTEIPSWNNGIYIVDSIAAFNVAEGFLIPDNEYIVFVLAEPTHLYGPDDSFGYLLSGAYDSNELGTWVLPVRNGKMIDKNEYFGIGAEIEVPVFKEYVRSWRDHI